MEDEYYVSEHLDEARYHLEEACGYDSNIQKELFVMLLKINQLMEELSAKDN